MKLVIRVFYILANEVSSERVFLAIKTLYLKTRNRLIEDRVDKLLFIQINLRTLRRRKQQSQSEP
jgi:hAT family C-terminal dimerisation region